MRYVCHNESIGTLDKPFTVPARIEHRSGRKAELVLAVAGTEYRLPLTNAMARDMTANGVPESITVFYGARTQAEQCQAFALCANPATTTIQHTILGSVPACQRCADKMARLAR